jgi:iron complex outermembrane receptor protein
MRFITIAAALAASSTIAVAAQAQTASYDIPAGSLKSALDLYRKQSGRPIVYKPEEVRGATSPGYRGSAMPEQVLDALLIGSGFGVRGGDYGSAAIVRVGNGPHAAADEVGGNDIIVTARKAKERAQDIPVSLTAATAEALRDRGAVDIKDILRSVPGLSNSGFERGLSRYSIRGLSSYANSPTTGIYLDDISLVTIATTFSGSYDPVFFDIQRVEVLKGPQGTLYGGSAMGGAIKYVSATPNLHRFSVDTAAGLAFTDHGAPSYTGEVVVNAPIVEDKLAVRGGFYYRHDGGYVDNVPGQLRNSQASSAASPTYVPMLRDSLATRTEDNQNHAETYVGRLSAEWHPDETWTIRPQAFYQNYRLANTGEIFLNRPGYTSSFRLPQPGRDKGQVYSLSVEKDLGAVRATSLTALTKRHFDYVRDYSYFIGGLVAPLFPIASNNLSTSNTKTVSQEFRLASNGGPSSRLKWVIGAYYADQDDRLVQSVVTPGAAALLGTDLVYFGNTFTNTKQYALFGEASFTVFPGFDITAGVRAFWINQLVDILGDGPFNGGRTEIDGRKSKENGMNPKIGVSYKVTRENLVYASAAKGFRPGGPNRYQIDPVICGADLARIGLSSAPLTYNSDSLWTYEAGTKNSFDGGKLTLNAAAYLTKWNKIQQSIGLSCGFGFTANIGKAEVKGFELEGRVEPVRGFELGGNLSFTDGKITQAVFGTTAGVGDKLTDVPKWTASAYVGYGFDLPARWHLKMRGEYQYQGKARYDYTPTLTVTYANGVVGSVPNPGQLRQSYDVVNAFAVLTRGNTAVRLYANNLFNARPLLDLDLLLGADRAFTLRPRTIGLEFRQGF